jgi:hypothetical protein
VTANERKLRKEKQIKSFFKEVDSGLFNEYSSERSFTDYLKSIERKSEYLQKRLITNGTDSLEFKIYCPYQYFCAFVSQFTFDRESDITFRY